MLEIRTLGGLSLNVAGQAFMNMGSRKAEAILVYLAIENREQNRDIISSLLWPEFSQEHASKSLRVALSILRKYVGEYLDISRETVRIRSDAKIYLDLSALEVKLENDHIDQALDIYQGDFLLGFGIHDSPEFEDWLRFEQERVRGSIVSALHESITRTMDSGDYARGVTFSRRLMEIDPLDELAIHVSMKYLAMDGQRTTALAQYQKYIVLLQEELGAEPSKEIQALYLQILRGEEPANLGKALPANNLPIILTSFIGRDAELAQISKLINEPDCRLLTLVGSGGCGKTRLALKVATSLLHSFPEGIRLVSLETCYSIDFLIPTIANALCFSMHTISGEMDPKTQLLDYLRNRSILLIMDGFENLIEGAGLLSEILGHAPGIKILVTSRQRLSLKSEWTFLLEGLSFQVEQGNVQMSVTDALRLFVERTRQVDTNFQLSEINYQPSTHICQLVEGIPLGIELAAAWTFMLSPSEIACEMEKNLDFLDNNMIDVPEKHRGPRAIFESSLQLLDKEQRDSFLKLSIFRGGFDQQAAMQVAGVGMQQLSALYDKSLLRRNASGRFSMHNLLQQYAAEKTNQLDEIRGAVYENYCQYFVNMLLRLESDLMNSRMLQARDEIQQELENVRAAVIWACLHWEEGPIRSMLNAMLSFYIVQGWHEGLDVFRNIADLRREAILSKEIPDPAKDKVILSARIHQAFFYSNLGQIDDSEAISRECLAALKDLGLREELSECLHNIGVNASFKGDYETAQTYLEESILIGRECDHFVWPSYLLWLGHVYFLLGEYEQGLISLNKSYEIFKQRGTFWGAAFALSKMGLAEDGLENHAQALQYHREALSIFESYGNLAGKGYSLSRMSMSAYFIKDFDLSVKYGLEGYQNFLEIGHRWGIGMSLCRLGFAFLGLGEAENARGYFKEALQKSRHDQMLPVSLYALAGLTCLLSRQGKGEESLELFQYVQQHPKTPTPYLKQASQWLTENDHVLMASGNAKIKPAEDLERIDAIIEKFLKIENPSGS